jgi:hypothetical protein
MVMAQREGVENLLADDSARSRVQVLVIFSKISDSLNLHAGRHRIERQ